MSLQRVETELLAAQLPTPLVAELINSYGEAKRWYFLDKHRPGSIEGGRFSEAVFRILQLLGTGTFTSIGKTLPSVDKLIAAIENMTGLGDDGLRLHIPRTLRVIYDIRNKRNAAHLGGIDPSRMDSSLVIHSMDWVMAELVRNASRISAHAAQTIIDDLVVKELPTIQEVNGFPVVLRSMKRGDHTLLLLYWRGTEGATVHELRRWQDDYRLDRMRQVLKSLREKALAWSELTDGDHWVILAPGIREVEARGLAAPP